MSVTLHLSCAVSADGYLDDVSSERAVLSSPEDLAAVLALRAKMDMIVVGAETLRRDDPSLATRGEQNVKARRAAGKPDHPIKMVVTRSGNIPADRAFFRDGNAEKIVLSQTEVETPGTLELFEGSVVEAIIRVAESRGARDVMIEGGAQLLQQAADHTRSLRLAVSPRRLGERGHARLIDDPQSYLDLAEVTRTEQLGNTMVYWIDPLLTHLRLDMETAFAMSEECPPSETAFAVGCVGWTRDRSEQATGYSRETGPSDHAEEALLSKLPNPQTVVVTLEPCLHRASKPTGCAERLVAAGVKRVVYALAEDETFTRQSGLAYLRDNGVEVIHLPGFEERFRAVNAAIYGPGPD